MTAPTFDITVHSGAGTVDLGTPAPEGICVGFACEGGNFQHNSGNVYPSLAGIPLTLLRWNRNGGFLSGIYDALEGLPPGEVTLSWAGPTNDLRILIARMSGGTIERVTDAAKSGAGGMSVTMDSGVEEAQGLIVAASNSGGASPTLPNTTRDGGVSNSQVGHETDPATGSRSIGFTAGAQSSVAAAMYRAVPALATRAPQVLVIA